MSELTAIIILAAGNSSRLGEPKQLLRYKNKTLLENTIAAASAVPNSIIIVVTGANHELIQKELYTESVIICYNPDWENGMSTSINAGLKKLLTLHPDIQKCIFTVCDQPYLSGAVFEDLLKEYFKTKKGIIASSYSQTLGTPVLFDKKYFDGLFELKGQEGAKKIITQFAEDTTSVLFDNGAIDIDTVEDYNNLIN
ncbi:NTP transferase domain-containing protein [Flavobacterium sp. HTF]|uniref:nucleotidyltransferase family protein n=1 Tax=Flavobacterium sp. HTF TaxID=2170732 RepID=UPI000D5E9261|nr:nucleotidyltransferase family protein [Flavobacterium sp. HTF]PWB27977.1 nucleotidyltransferase family protein [Flavobacterium sp. HTF]